MHGIINQSGRFVHDAGHFAFGPAQAAGHRPTAPRALIWRTGHRLHLSRAIHPSGNKHHAARITSLPSAFHFGKALNVNKITLVEEINRSEVAVEADDDRGLRKVTLRKEKLKRRELSRVKEILSHIPDSLIEGIKVHSQNIFGTRGYSIGHYAKVVRADLLIMNAAENRKGFFGRVFPQDLEHILSELPTDVLVIKSKGNG